MKKNHLRCLHCKKAFESRRNDAKFCSNGCRTNAYLERHNKEKPAFLSKQKPPEKSDNISGVESRQTPQMKLVRVENPEWLELQRITNTWKEELEKLQKERVKLIEKHNRIAKKDNRIATAIAGGAIGVGIGKQTKATDGETFAITVAGAFFAYHLLGSKESDMEVSKRRSDVIIEIRAINEKIMYVESVFMYHLYFPNKPPRYLIKQVEIPQTEQIHGELPADKKPPEKASKAGIMNSAQIAEMKFDTWNFTGIWGDFLGSPDKGFAALIFGKAGAGKSTFALRLAHYFAEHHGKVLFIASEERVGESLKHKINTYKLQSQNLFIGVPAERSFEDAKKLIEENKSPFIFIDSINHLQISVKQVEELRKKYPKITFVMVFQATKDGQIKGTAEYEHNADIVVKVEDKQAHTKKNRFRKNQIIHLQSLSSLEQSIIS